MQMYHKREVNRSQREKRRGIEHREHYILLKGLEESNTNIQGCPLSARPAGLNVQNSEPDIQGMENVMVEISAIESSIVLKVMV
jgi:hypothetical protein